MSEKPRLLNLQRAPESLDWEGQPAVGNSRGYPYFAEFVPDGTVAGTLFVDACAGAVMEFVLAIGFTGAVVGVLEAGAGAGAV